MKVFFKKIPLALSSLVLALFSLSNQINHYALIAQGIWFLASIGFMLILGRLILGFEQVREDLHNPVIASAFASYFMAAFLFASRLPLAQIGLSVTWVGILGLYIAYIIFFSLRFMRPLSLNQVFPSWFVVYVGPAISLVTVPASVPTSIKGLSGSNGISDSVPLSTCFMENETDSHPSPISAYTCHFSSTSGPSHYQLNQE